MSRSVTLDYDKLRERTIPTLTKHSAVIHISDELLFQDRAYVDARYDRKHIRHWSEPTAEDWALYHQAVRGKLAMEAYEGTEWGGPDTGTDVHKPEPRVTYEYLETNDEWLARCRALRQETT